MAWFSTLRDKWEWKLLLLIIWGGIGASKLLRDWQTQMLEPQFYLVLLVAILTVRAVFGPSRARWRMMKLWAVLTFLGLALFIVLFMVDILCPCPLTGLEEAIKNNAWVACVLGVITMIGFFGIGWDEWLSTF